MLKARIKEYSLDEVIQAIENIEKSPFLKGQNKNGWMITFDWLIRPNNFPKVLEGNYIDKNKGGNNDNEGLHSRDKNRGNDKESPYDYDKFFN